MSSSVLIKGFFVESPDGLERNGVIGDGWSIRNRTLKENVLSR